MIRTITLEIGTKTQDTTRVKWFESTQANLSIISLFKGNNGANIYWIKTPYFRIEIKVDNKHPLYFSTTDNVLELVEEAVFNNKDFLYSVFHMTYENGHNRGRNCFRKILKHLLHDEN